MNSRSTRLTKTISIPEAGIFVGIAADGRLFKKVPNVRMRGGGTWIAYPDDILSLALEGRETELKALMELTQ